MALVPAPGSRFLMKSRSTSTEQMSLHFGEAFSAQGRQQSQVEVRCRQCRKPVQVPEWYPEERLSLYFCNAGCRDAWSRETPSLEVKLTRPSGHRGANWQIQAQKARQRDGFTCQICGVSEEELGRQMDVHHKIPYRSFQSNVEANKLEHLLSVCPPCHARLEAELQEELPLFRKP